MLPGGSEDRKWHTRGQGEWRVLLKWGAMELYTLCTYCFSKWAASAWQVGSEGRDGSGAARNLWLSQTDGKAEGRKRRDGSWTVVAIQNSHDSHRPIRFPPQRHGSCLILRNVKDVRVSLLLKVNLLRIWLSGGVWAEDCGSRDGTTSNFRGVILRGERGQLGGSGSGFLLRATLHERRAASRRDRLELTHGSTGICSLPSSPEDYQQVTPEQPGHRRDGGNPSQSERNSHTSDSSSNNNYLGLSLSMNVLRKIGWRR